MCEEGLESKLIKDMKEAGICDGWNSVRWDSGTAYKEKLIHPKFNFFSVEVFSDKKEAELGDVSGISAIYVTSGASNQNILLNGYVHKLNKFIDERYTGEKSARPKVSKTPVYSRGKPSKRHGI